MWMKNQILRITLKEDFQIIYNYEMQANFISIYFLFLFVWLPFIVIEH